MVNGKVRKAQRQGPVRIHWSDESYSDFDSREDALEHAALAEEGNLHAVRMEDQAQGVTEGADLEAAVKTRQVAMAVYELIRLDPRMDDMAIGIQRLSWTGDDALYSFSGYGPHRPKDVSADALKANNPQAIADSLICWVAKEIDFRNGIGG